MKKARRRDADVTLPRIAITPGDPAGIGPEVLVKALAEPSVYEVCRPVAVADADALSEALRTVGIPLRLNVIESLDDASFTSGTLDLLDVATGLLPRVRTGEASRAGGEAAVAWIQRAVTMAREGQVDGLVVGPTHAKALRMAGHADRTNADLLAGLTGARHYASLLISGPVRIAQVANRVPLRDVPAFIEKTRVLSTIKVVRQALIELGIEQPRIGVAALNPDESGEPGREDAQEVVPAVQAAVQDLGFDVEGPLPAALLAARLVRGYYDAGVAMYDDQAQITVMAHDPRLDDWGRGVAVAGVDVTIGLPVVAVSVGHGPAFDIAGQGIANGQAMAEAIRVAADLASRRPRQG
jgi:4-hydroxy-L-threonine phosphate dehydrogenase PdxA